MVAVWGSGINPATATAIACAWASFNPPAILEKLGEAGAPLPPIQPSRAARRLTGGGGGVGGVGGVTSGVLHACSSRWPLWMTG